MPSYRAPCRRAERTAAFLAAGLINAALIVMLLDAPRAAPPLPDASASLPLIRIALPAPPPAPPHRRVPRASIPAGGAAVREMPATPPAPQRVSAPYQTTRPALASVTPANAPGVGTGTSGDDLGKGSGSGSGAGSGAGNGNGIGNGLASDARLLGGGLDRRDYRDLRRLDSPAGMAVLALLVGADGRVAECRPAQSSGNPAIDQRLCAILTARMVWAPARDRQGRPVSAGIRYTAVWRRD